MKDKVRLLMEETGCDRSEAELALELCGYSLETAISAVPRLFQNVTVFKGRLAARSESLYGLWLAILDLKEKSLLRARAVVSYNPAVYSSELDRHWFDFEGRLYACRLWAGTLQGLSQEVEKLLGSYFDSPEAAPYYEEGVTFGGKDFDSLRTALAPILGGAVELDARQDILDRGQFEEVRPPGPPAAARKTERRSRVRKLPGQKAGGLLVVGVALEDDPGGVACADLRAGDMVYATIDDGRDIAQYLATLFGARSEDGPRPVLVPVEAIEKDETDKTTIRVRFSAGVCGDVTVPGGVKLKAARRTSKTSWWRKFFGGG